MKDTLKDIGIGILISIIVGLSINLIGNELTIACISILITVYWVKENFPLIKSVKKMLTNKD